ncbi:MAG TPA: serine hydrolase domain-containing protein, partial [Blastocatellia bacterium]
MSRLHRFFAAVLILLMASQTAAPQERPKPTMASLKSGAGKEPIVARLESVIPRLLEQGMVPGLSIALIQKGELAWHRGFGVKNSQTKESVAANTMFEAASLSKPVFAYAVMKLVDAGKLSLDTPLNKYLPGNYDVGEDAR